MTSPTIEILPEHIIDQIKAGEVIERPASLIKEILENSIDAGSSHISIHIFDNGLESIIIKDNGHGMDKDRLPLAFHRHATSKINRFEDLYKLHSFGFRGEALASIASISKVKCISTNSSGKTSSIEIHGGKTVFHDELQGEYDQGTTFYINDLFFNTPARLKFIKSAQSEKNALLKTIHSFILSNPQINFELKWDDKNKTSFSSQTLQQRIQDFYKNEAIKFSEKEYDGIEVKSYLVQSAASGLKQKKCFFFVNNRSVHIKSAHAIIQNIIKSQFTPYSGYAIFIKVPPSKIDVNVHPNKTEVRFFEQAKVNSLVSGTIKEISDVKNNNLQDHQQSISSSVFNTPESSHHSGFSTKESQFNYKDINEDNDIANKVSTESPFQTIMESQKYFLIKEHEGKVTFLCNKFELLKCFLIETFSPQKIIKTESAPLLVSVPIRSEHLLSPQMKNHLEKFGLELDSLHNNQILLRSIPTSLIQLDFKSLITPLIEAFLKSSQEDFHLFLLDELSQEIIDKFSINENLRMQFKSHPTSYTEFTDISLDKVFYEKK